MAAQHRSATDQTLAVLVLRPLTAGVEAVEKVPDASG